jgi:hypothetical protein
VNARCSGSLIEGMRAMKLDAMNVDASGHSSLGDPERTPRASQDSVRGRATFPSFAIGLQVAPNVSNGAAILDVFGAGAMHPGLIQFRRTAAEKIGRAVCVEDLIVGIIVERVWCIHLPFASVGSPGDLGNGNELLSKDVV